MRNMSDELKALMANEGLSLAYLFKLTLYNGTVLYFTDNSVSIFYNNEVWRADPGVDISAIRDAANSVSQTATVEVGYSEDGLTERMVRRGALDGATHQVLLIDYQNPGKGAVEVFSGNLDRVTASNKYSCSIDLTGWQGKSYTLGGVYSLKCRNVFCDAGCKLNINDYSYDFTVAADSINGVDFAVAEQLPDKAGVYGSVLWTDGRNNTLVVPVATSGVGSISLINSPAFNPLAGDKGKLRAGCDYFKETCVGKYNNLANFEGEPSAPQGTTTSAEKTTTAATIINDKPAASAGAVYTGGDTPQGAPTFAYTPGGGASEPA